MTECVEHFDQALGVLVYTASRRQHRIEFFVIRGRQLRRSARRPEDQMDGVRVDPRVADEGRVQLERKIRALRLAESDEPARYGASKGEPARSAV